MSKKNPSRADRLSEAMAKLLTAKDEIERLKEEIDNWIEGLSTTNLSMSFKYEHLEECSYALEEIIDEIDTTTGREHDVIFPGMF